MKGIKILIGAAAVASAGAVTAGILMNTRRARLARAAKRASNIMYSVGSVLQILSCRDIDG